MAYVYVQGVRHGVYVRDSTNQSAAVAYITLRTSRGVRTLFDQSARGIFETN